MKIKQEEKIFLFFNYNFFLLVMRKYIKKRNIPFNCKFFNKESSSNSTFQQIERGCITSEITSCDDPVCQKCTTNNCNNQVYPYDRHKCLKFSKSTSTSIISEYCNLYGSNQCITFYDNGKILNFFKKITYRNEETNVHKLKGFGK